MTEVKKDVICARRCMTIMKGFECNDEDCKNLSCPLNKKHLEAEDGLD